MSVDLSVIIVSWNVKDLLARCLASVYRGAEGLEVEAIVIDNASSDSSAAMVSQSFPQVQLLVNQGNRGFTVAANQGLRQATGRYWLLLNPDTEVLGDALAQMVAYLEAHPAVGVVGPQLLNPDGSVQSSRRRFPTLATALVESTILQRYFPQAALLRRYYCLDQSDAEENEVDWLVGACLMVRREVAAHVGLLDERFFMYSEELDWCYRIKKAGWRVAYLPQARVIHHYGQSSARDLPHRHIYFQDSKCRFFTKHRGPLVGQALRAYLMGTYLFQLGEEGIKWLLGHKRPLRQERMGLYLRVIRSGLRARPVNGPA